MRSKLIPIAVALGVIGLVVASAGSVGAMLQSGSAQVDDTVEDAQDAFDDGVDGNTSIAIDEDEARAAANEELGSPSEGDWRLTEVDLHEDDGYYEYEYVLDNSTHPGEAEVRVDGSTGDVFRLETEIETDETIEEDDREEEFELKLGDDDDANDDAMNNDEFEGNEDEFESGVSSVDTAAGIVTLDDGRTVAITDDTQFEADGDLQSLDSVASALDNDRTVRVEGHAQTGDGSADLDADSVKFEVDDDQFDD